MIRRLDICVVICIVRRSNPDLTGSSKGGGYPCGCPACWPSGQRCSCCLSACSSGGGSKPTIKIGSVGFDEARVMAEIYAQALEANGYTVDRTGIGLGARPVVAARPSRAARSTSSPSTSAAVSATTAGRRPVTPRPTSTALQPAGQRQGSDGAELHAGRGHERVRRPPDTAQQYNLTKMSDLAAVQTQLKWGLADRLPDQPAVRQAGWRARSVRHHPADGRRRDAAGGVRHADGRRAQGRNDRRCRAVLDAARHHRQRLDRRSTTTRPLSRPTTSRRSCATTTWPRSTRRRSRRSSTTCRPRSTRRRWPTCTSRSAVDHKDAKDVAAAWLKAKGFVK